MRERVCVRERERERERESERGERVSEDSHLLLIPRWVLVSGQIRPLLNSLIKCPL